LRTWKLTLEYDGTRYSGWAEQTNARGIMNELRGAAEEVFASKVDLQGAGRTDAGVHATGQVAHLRAAPRQAVSPQQILKTFNERLPADIVVLDVTPAPAGFHARHSAVSREYVYRISRRKSAFSKKYVWWVKEPLDVARMAEAAKVLPGRHNFIRFRAKDPARPGESTIVEVSQASVEEMGHEILFRITASHFLWRMVRRLAGALVRVGKGELLVADFRQLVDARGPELDVASWTAPASGLCLTRVNYH